MSRPITWVISHDGRIHFRDCGSDVPTGAALTSEDAHRAIRAGDVTVCPACKRDAARFYTARPAPRVTVYAHEVDDCPACEQWRRDGVTFHPAHTASAGCESGRRNHCTCDVCF